MLGEKPFQNVLNENKVELLTELRGQKDRNSIRNYRLIEDKEH